LALLPIFFAMAPAARAKCHSLSPDAMGSQPEMRTVIRGTADVFCVACGGQTSKRSKGDRKVSYPGIAAHFFGDGACGASKVSLAVGNQRSKENVVDEISYLWDRRFFPAPAAG
jgi:hypothetical protein